MTGPQGHELRPIEGFPGYLVATDGSVWSARGRGNPPHHFRPSEDWERLTLYRRPYGARYVVVCLRAEPGGRVWQKYVPRLVLEAFVAPCPGGMECLHGDGDTANNRLATPRWGTPAENAQDARRHGR